MNEYHKIQSVFKRNPADGYKTMLFGEYTEPEFEYLANNEWVFTEKVDGTNIRVMWRGGKQLTFGGKTDNAAIPSKLVEWLNNTFQPQREYFETAFVDVDVCLYGEGYGAKIQAGGGLYRPDQAFVLFDVKVGDYWLRRDDVISIATRLSIEYVPVIGRGTLPEMVKFVGGGFQSQWGAFEAEGVVARPAVELKTRSGHRIITKLKHRDFPK